MNVLGLITARGGSKSIPKKNIASCGGNPLMHYCIKAAQNAKLITRLIISTDDEEIAAIAKSYGVEAPFLRPAEFAQDDSPDILTFQHMLQWLKEHEDYRPDVVVHLRPTAPLMRSEDLDKGIELLLKNPEADSVRGVFVTPATPFKMYKLDAAGYLVPLLKPEFPEVYEQFPEPFNAERQLLPKIWRQVGDVDVTRVSTLEQGVLNGEKILPLFLSSERKIDIDDPKDLARLEALIEELRAEGREVWE